MREFALLGLALLFSAPAIAGTTKQSPDSEVFSGGAPQSKQSIDALLHHQPRRSDIQQREIRRYGPQTVEQEQQRSRAELDQLYEDVMRRSAPPPSK